jgi:hypothetical protein
VNLTEYHFFNIQGKPVIGKPNLGIEKSLDVSSLQSGIYLIRFSGNEKTVTQKFIKK